jgi:hypothetical protein
MLSSAAFHSNNENKAISFDKKKVLKGNQQSRKGGILIMPSL